MNNSYLILLFIVPFWSCTDTSVDSSYYKNYTGKTMGTTFHIKVKDSLDLTSGEKIDSILKRINAEVSTYIPSSTISRFNQADSLICFPDSLQHFHINYSIAKEIYKETNGYYDPTVMPLVNYWGFGYEGRVKQTDIDSNVIKEILGYTGFEKVSMIEKPLGTKCYIKEDSRIELDFSASAKGYAVDVLADYMTSCRSENYFIEIGGEVSARGKNASDEIWTVGINVPKSGSSRDAVFKPLKLHNSAVATSGNYRNFYRQDGRIITHTINPFTGFTEPRDILSATIFHNKCAIADAYATASMSMGVKNAKMVMHENMLSYFFIASENDSIKTFSRLINNKNNKK